MISDASKFRADAPIQGKASDKLERSGFAGRLADSIQSWIGDESLVVGIHGDWGSGKSSVKNMVLERLAEYGDTSSKVLEFNPWMISGEQSVADAFFLEMEMILQQENLGQEGKNRAMAWRKYARHFKTAAKVANAVDVALPIFGAMPGIGTMMAGRLRDASGLMMDAADSAAGKSKPIDEQKREVRDWFAKLLRKLVVVIDDIDRLTDEEIRVMFRLVKATSDFPNTIFLLLFQKSTVATALNPICGNQGEVFLEKIVQVDLGLPVLPQSKLGEFWVVGIQEILGEEQVKILLEDGRLSHCWHNGLKHYFRNLRDVTRLLNSFAFMVGGMKTEGVWEINLADLMVVETLRLFDPNIYRILANNKGLLAESSGREKSEHLDALAKELIGNRASGRLDESDFKDLLSELFPSLCQPWRNMSYGEGHHMKWIREKRVCAERFFDVYFRFALPSGQPSEALIARILAINDDREGLRAEVQQMEEEGKLFDLLERLEAEESLVDGHSLAYVLALSDLCDYWPRTPRQFLATFPGSLYANRAAYRLLRNIKERDRKLQTLLRLIKETEGVLIASDWIERLSVSDNPNDDDDYEQVWPKCDHETLSTVKVEWLDKVRQRSQDGRFFRINETAWVLNLWSKWGGEEEVLDWLRAQSPPQVAWILKGLVSTLTSSGEYRNETKHRIRWKALEPFGDRAYWADVLQGIRASELREELRGIDELLESALSRWEKGFPDKDFPED